ncbi:MAG: hypothetical protein KAU20_01855 [Nanoarchaeota archaeon]|nr:hypothetical protein [Nanoarchaeota archaeon]
MQHYQISNKDAKTLNQVVSSSDFKSTEAVLRHLIQNCAHELIQPQGIVIDLQPAEDGAYKTQENWIALYNTQEGEFKGKRMISAPDVIGASELASPEALASLQKDCRESWVITSTHISYQPDTLAGVVTHNYQSAVVSPKVISLDEIPVLKGEPASKVVETTRGLSYVRALADDRYAKPATLLKRLVALSHGEKEPEKITLWTPDRGLRRLYTERAVGFGDDVCGFRVYGSILFSSVMGRSRAVLINPRSGYAKK